jgi:integration host factor subunit alpha
MTKIDLIRAVLENFGGREKEASELVDAFFEIMKETLENGKEIKISGFGNWGIREKKARIGRNPRNGEPKEISARRVVFFKVSNILKKKLNEE